MRLGGRLEPKQRAEPPRIPVAERHARIEDNIEMVVRRARRHPRQGLQASGHPEVNEQSLRADTKEQVLAPPIDAFDDAPGEILFERARNRPTKTPVVDARSADEIARVTG